MAEGSRGFFENAQKGPEHLGEIVELRPRVTRSEEKKTPSPAKAGRREADVAVARREALRLHLGGAPTSRQFSSEQMRLNEQLGVLRAERTSLKKELLNADARRDPDRAARLKDIELEIGLIEVRRADIGYWLSLEKTGGKDEETNVEAQPMGEIDALRQSRFAVQAELGELGTGIFSYFKRRALEARLRDIDRQTRVLIDQQRQEELLAAK